MSFLIPALATLGTTMLPRAISWIGKKINGTFLGNAASSVTAKNPQLLEAGNNLHSAVRKTLERAQQYDSQQQSPAKPRPARRIGKSIAHRNRFVDPEDQQESQEIIVKKKANNKGRVKRRRR